MASPYDLTSLAAFKAWAGISTSSSDAVLGPLITSVSRSFMAYLSKPSILPRTLTERYDGQGNSRMFLRNWPVISVSQVLVGSRAVPASSAPVVNVPLADGWLLEPWDGAPPGGLQAIDVYGCYEFCRGRQNVTVTYVAGYAVTGEVQTVPGTPYQITPLQPYGPWGNDQGVTYANGTALTKVATSSPTVGQYSVTSTGIGNAVYQFAAADTTTSVVLGYGYIPQDISQACIDQVDERYSYRDRIGQKSKSLGGQETISYDLSAIPAAVKMVLDAYRAVVIPA